MMEGGKIVLIGAGNVAYHLSTALLQARWDLCQVYSRTMESARELGERTGVAYTNRWEEVYPDGDIYIVCVNDDSLPVVAKQLKVTNKALRLHTSGSQPLEVFKPHTGPSGVMYPVQSFSRRWDVDFRQVPLCVEGNSPVALAKVRALANSLSDCVKEVDSRRRKELHLAAVLVNNFPNFLYMLAEKRLMEHDLNFELLRPLIRETAAKVMHMRPEEAQTGPARRNDESVLGMHRALLKDDRPLLEVYSLLSEAIRTWYTEKEETVKVAEKSKTEDGMLTLW